MNGTWRALGITETTTLQGKRNTKVGAPCCVTWMARLLKLNALLKSGTASKANPQDFHLDGNLN
jgi:hypothetical protein